MPELGTRWDWYEATLDGFDEGQLGTSLGLIFGATVTPGRGRNGYSISHAVERNGDTLAKVYERSARPGEVHIEVPAAACDEVVPVLRRNWPHHRVTRADSSVDFVTDFDELDRIVTAFATARGVTHRLFTNSEGGATRYLGSPRSEVMVRVYKKTEQLRQVHPERASSVPDGVVRAELVARPNKREAKEAAATLTPDAAWGLSRWSRDLAALVLGIDPPRTATHFRRPADDERAMHFLVEQYGPLMRRRALQHGIDAFLAELVDRASLGEPVGAETA